MYYLLILNCYIFISAENKRTKFLDCHPEAPHLPKKEKLPPKTGRPLQRRNKKENQNTDIAWQIQWMVQYDELKKESGQKIEQQQKLCAEKEDVIEALERKLVANKMKMCEKNKRVKSQMTKMLGKRRLEIRRLKMKLKLIQMQAEKEAETIEKANQAKLDEQILKMSVSKDHSYARTYSPVVKIYHCKSCSFQTEKKSTLNDHNEIHQAPIRNLNCPICHKNFNHRRLRLHYNYFITQLKKTESDAHKPTGAHSNFDLKFHEDLANKLKLSKQQK